MVKTKTFQPFLTEKKKGFKDFYDLFAKFRKLLIVMFISKRNNHY